MSDGAYRDDQEAALARAEALENELATQKRENEKLREENEALAAKARVKAKPAPVVPEPPRKATAAQATEDRRKLIQGAALVAILLACVILWFALGSGRRSKSDQEIENKRWIAVQDAPACMKNALVAFSFDRLDADLVDPRKPVHKTADFERPITLTCYNKLGRLMAMPAYASIVDGIRTWRASVDAYMVVQKDISDYYVHRDWMEDSYAAAPAKWAALKHAAAGTAVAADGVRDRLLAITHDEMRRYQRAWEKANGRDPTWWYFELGISIQLAADERRFGDPARADALMAMFDARVKDAPLEVRRFDRTRTHQITEKGSFYNELLNHIDSAVP